jgi:hypothetical protein
MRRAIVERSISTVSWSSPTAAAKSARFASSVPSIRSSKLFSEDDDLAALAQADLLEQPLQLVELGGAARLLVHEPRGVAGHAQPLEGAHEPLLLQGGERPLLENGEEPGRGRLRVVVVLTLLRRHRHDKPRDKPLRKVLEHLFLAAPQHHGRQPGSEEVEVPVAGRAPGPVELRELFIEATAAHRRAPASGAGVRWRAGG